MEDEEEHAPDVASLLSRTRWEDVPACMAAWRGRDILTVLCLADAFGGERPAAMTCDEWSAAGRDTLPGGRHAMAWVPVPAVRRLPLGVAVDGAVWQACVTGWREARFYPLDATRGREPAPLPAPPDVDADGLMEDTCAWLASRPHAPQGDMLEAAGGLAACAAVILAGGQPREEWVESVASCLQRIGDAPALLDMGACAVAGFEHATGWAARGPWDRPLARAGRLGR